MMGRTGQRAHNARLSERYARQRRVAERRLKDVLARAQVAQDAPPPVKLKTEQELDQTLPERSKRIGRWVDVAITPNDRALEKEGERVVRVSRCLIVTRGGATEGYWHIEFAAVPA